MREAREARRGARSARSLAPPRPSPELGDVERRLDELAEVLREVIEVLAQPDAVMRAGRRIDGVLGVERGRVEGRGRASARPIDDRGEVVVPECELARAMVESSACCDSCDAIRRQL